MSLCARHYYKRIDSFEMQEGNKTAHPNHGRASVDRSLETTPAPLDMPGPVGWNRSSSANRAEEDSNQVHFSAVSGPELGYAYIVPIGDFSGMDAFIKNWSELSEKVGPEKWGRIAAESGAAMDHYSDTHFLLRPDLSYEPEQPRLKAGETHFIQFLFYYGVPGKEGDLETASKEYASLFRKKGVSMRFRVYQAVSGSDLPLYVVVESGRSEADYYQNADAVRKELGEEGQNLARKAARSVRRVQAMSAVPRPDLSYPPPHAAN